MAMMKYLADSNNNDNLFDNHFEIYTSCLCDYCDIKKTIYFIFYDYRYNSVEEIIKDIKFGVYEFCSKFPIVIVWSERLQKFILITKSYSIIDIIRNNVTKFKFKDMKNSILYNSDSLQKYNPYLSTMKYDIWIKNLEATILPETIRIVSQMPPRYQAEKGFVQEFPFCEKNIFGIDTEYCFIIKKREVYSYIFIPCYIIDNLFNSKCMTNIDIINSNEPA